VLWILILNFNDFNLQVKTRNFNFFDYFLWFPREIGSFLKYDSLKGCSHVEVLFSHDRKKNFFSTKKYFWRGRNMYFTKNRVNLYRFVPIFTIFMFRPLQKKFFWQIKFWKFFFCKKFAAVWKAHWIFHFFQN
jgi:hypothetical protein